MSFNINTCDKIWRASFCENSLITHFILGKSAILVLKVFTPIPNNKIQADFDRAYRLITQDPNYNGRNLLYISGLHVDISPEASQQYVLTKFLPWAAYIQLKNGEKYILEQEKLIKIMDDCSIENPNQLDFDEVINLMEDAVPITLNLPY